MSNDEKFKLILTLRETGERHYLDANPAQASKARNAWKYSHGENIVIEHIGGDYCIPHNLIQSISILPIETDEEQFKSRLSTYVYQAPNLALEIAMQAIVRKNLDPFKEGLSSLDKRVDYFVGQLEAKGTPKSQPKQSEDDRALCTLDARNPHLAKCCIAEPTEAERLKQIQRAS